jgi:modulator of FtsH protease HflC
MNSKIVAGLLLVFFVIMGTMCAYTVDETQQVVITRFSKVNRTEQEPGLKFKLPIVERAIFYPRNLQEWDGDPGEIPTKDKTYIYVDTFARWKIDDPVLFFKSIGTKVELATNRLNEIIDPAVRNLITSNRLIESVRNSNRELDTFELGLEKEEKREQRKAYSVKVGRQKITAMILKEAHAKLQRFGIDLLDVEIKRLNYTEEVRQSVYDRMIAERKQIAQKFRSEGKGEAQKILGDKELDLKRIQSEAYRKAQEIKGRADATATKLYAEAFGRDPEFYSFVKTMEIYDEPLDKDSTLILSTDSDLLKYLKGYSQGK